MTREGAPSRIPRVGTAQNSQPVVPVGAARHFGGIMPRGWALLATALVCVAIGAIALWRAQPQDTGVPFGSVAVLPFVSDSSGNNYLANGLTEAVLNWLVQLQSLRVAPRASASPYKDAGRELDVAAVVTAAISQQDSNLRIQVDLVDVAHDAQVWGA
jgi:hypothetical protein